MQQIIVELNGDKKEVDLNQLKSLVRVGLVKDSSRVWIDNREFSYSDLASGLMGESSSSVPSANDSAPVQAQRVPIPQNNENGTDSETPKSSTSSKTLIYALIGALVCCVFVIGILLGRSGKNKGVSEQLNAPQVTSALTVDQINNETAEQGQKTESVSTTNVVETVSEQSQKETQSSSAQEAVKTATVASLPNVKTPTNSSLETSDSAANEEVIASDETKQEKKDENASNKIVLNADDEDPSSAFDDEKEDAKETSKTEEQTKDDSNQTLSGDSNSKAPSNEDYTIPESDGDVVEMNAVLDNLGYSLTPFDVRAKKIEVGYKGNNIAELCKVLQGNRFSLEQTQYETDKEFRKRQQDLAKNLPEMSVMGQLKFGSKFAFVVPPDNKPSDANFSNEHIYTDYNAKKRILRVSKSIDDFFTSQTFNKREGTSFVLKTNVEKRGSYMGITPLGVRGEVEQKTMRTYGLAIEYKHVKSGKAGYINRWYLRDVPSEKARELEGKLAVLCLCGLGVHQETNFAMFTDCLISDKPTIKYPFEYWYFTYAPHAKDVEFWIYNFETGEIYNKFSATDTFNERAKVFGDVEEGSVADEDRNIVTKTQDVEAVKTVDVPWEETYALRETEDSPEPWETAEPTVTVPDDAKTLFDGIKQAMKTENGVVLLKGESVEAGASILAQSLKITKPVSIRSESGATTVYFARDVFISVESKGVNFKGLNFVRENGKVATSGKDSATDEPIIVIAKDGEASIKDSTFDGGLIEKAIGVNLEGEGAKVKLWNCQFSQFVKSAVLGESGSFQDVAFCQFGENNTLAIDAFDGTFNIQKSRFFGNKVAIKGTGDASGTVDLTYFEKNGTDVSTKKNGAIKVTKKDGRERVEEEESGEIDEGKTTEVDVEKTSAKKGGTKKRSKKSDK